MASTATSLAQWLRRDKVSSLNLRAVCRVSPGDSVADVVRAMVDCRTGFVLVMDGADRLVGIITDGDLRRNLGNGLLALDVEEVMTPGPRTIAPDALAASAIEMLNSAAIMALIVVEDGRPVGIVHMHDLLRAGIA